MAAGNKPKSANAVVPAGLSRDEILKVLELRARAGQHELARAEDAGADVLDYLAAHGAVATRRAVAANPAAPPVANRRLADDADDDVRAELARKIARLMPDLSRDEQDHLRVLTIETLERLARDQEPRVRAALADGIKSLDCIPRNVVLCLARDVEVIVAGPNSRIFAAAFGRRSDRNPGVRQSRGSAAGRRTAQAVERRRVGCDRGLARHTRGGGASRQSQGRDPRADARSNHRTGRTRVLLAPAADATQRSFGARDQAHSVLSSGRL